MRTFQALAIEARTAAVRENRRGNLEAAERFRNRALEYEQIDRRALEISAQRRRARNG